MPTFGSWEFTVDRDATIAAYALAEKGGADACSCNGCRNFVVARDRAYPPAFLSLLDSLGIDSRKDGEVYHNGRLAHGRHDYAGWFHFIGTLELTGDFPEVSMGEGFTVCFLRKGAPELEPLRGHPLVQLEFHSSNVPWVLSEEESI